MAVVLSHQIQRLASKGIDFSPPLSFTYQSSLATIRFYHIFRQSKTTHSNPSQYPWYLEWLMPKFF